MRALEQSIAIVAGGVNSKRFLGSIKASGLIIGVDRGALWLLQQGVMPHMAIGDFDSVTPRQLLVIKKKIKKVLIHPKRKNATDLELAIDESIRIGATKVVIYGAVGTRFDHTLASVHMLLKLLSHNIYGEIVDNFNKINIVRRKHVINHSSDYPYISIFPLISDAVVTLSGFEYDIVSFRLQHGSTLGVSNEIRRPSAMLTVHKGAVLVIQSSDRVVR